MIADILHITTIIWVLYMSALATISGQYLDKLEGTWVLKFCWTISLSLSPAFVCYQPELRVVWLGSKGQLMHHQLLRSSFEPNCLCSLIHYIFYLSNACLLHPFLRVCISNFYYTYMYSDAWAKLKISLLESFSIMLTIYLLAVYRYCWKCAIKRKFTLQRTFRVI